MGVAPARNADITVGSLAAECYVSEFEQAFTNTLSDAGNFCSSGPRMVVTNNDWTVNLSGPNDFATAAYDEAIFALRSSTGFAYNMQPTGTSGNTSTPEYQGTAVLASYTIRGGNNTHYTHQTNLAGNSSMKRDTD